MKIQPRIILLVSCFALGITAAVGVALRSPAPHEENAAATSSADQLPNVKLVRLSRPALKAPSREQATAEFTPTYPTNATVFTPLVTSPADQRSDRMAKSIEELQKSLADVQHEADEHKSQLIDLLMRRQDEGKNQSTKREEPQYVQAPAPLPAPTIAPSELPPATSVTRDVDDEKLTIVLQDSDIRDALKLLGEQGGLNILASEKVSGKLTASLSGLDPASALAAILKLTTFVARFEDGIVYVATPEEFTAMDQNQDRIVTRVYRPNYISAADLEKLFTPLMTESIGKVTVSTPAEVDIPSDQNKTGGNMLAESDVVIVRDYAQVLAQLDELFAEVDVMPRQVSIEAMIVNVRLNDENKMGVSFEALRNKGTIKIQSELPTGQLPPTPATGAGLKIGFLDSGTDALLTALETIGDTNVVASPRLTCLNKMRAEIQIGEQLGYVNTTVTQTFSTQSVSFLDVGTLLRLRPFIGNDGTIRMEVHPELSTGSVSVSGSLTLPNKSVTQVTTNVMCTDGCTAIIGGLIREDLQTTTSQIPFLGSTPWIGPLFRQKTEKVGRSEIIILITPRIISSDVLSEEGMKYGNQFSKRQENYFDKMNPLGKRHLGLAHLRRARAANAVGDHKSALQQVNLAIHYDSENREASTLREEIVANGGFEQESIPAHLRQGLSPLARPRKDYSKQGAPWKSEPPFTQGASFTVSDDEGTPGKIRSIEPQRPKLQPIGKTR